MSSAARCGRLETAVVELQRRLGESEKLNAYLLDQLSETNLKLTYVLRWFKFQRQVKSPLVDPQTGKQRELVEQLTLEVMFARDRDRFIDILVREADHARAQADAEAAVRRTPLVTVGAPEARDGGEYKPEPEGANGARPGPAVVPLGTTDEAHRTRH